MESNTVESTLRDYAEAIQRSVGLGCFRGLRSLQLTVIIVCPDLQQKTRGCSICSCGCQAFGGSEFFG